ncbi:Replication protein RepA [Lacticaseibacillus paracasei subsp. paracasei Lpp120]|nr:Replication protein RepA [Lacticaseibacillus paracasei subsp. paracasei Lpp120]
MNQFNYISSKSVYGDLFFKFPKVLLYSEKYRGLSDSAKIAYIVLKDRLEFSIRNNWVDEDNHVYFIFTNAELESLFNCHNQKVVKIKKELTNAGLLEQKQMGFDPKSHKNVPNRLYLANLEVTASDVYLCGSTTGTQLKEEPDMVKSKTSLSNKHFRPLNNSGNVKITLPHEQVEPLDNSGNVKITLPHERVDEVPQPLDNSGNVKITHNQYKTLDTNPRDNKETEKLNFSAEQYSPETIQKQNQDLVRRAKDYLPESANGGLFLNKEGVVLLGLWCHSPKQMHRFLGIILNAKKAVEREHEGTAIVLDDPQCQEMINKTMRRFFNVLRSDSKKINNVENYLFGAMKETLVAYWNKSLANTSGGDFNEF